jgi:hypothetical protein
MMTIATTIILAIYVGAAILAAFYSKENKQINNN